MGFVILTVEKHGNYTLGLANVDKVLENEIVVQLDINLGNELININESLVTYINQGRLTCPQINIWIMENNLIDKEKPVKLIFRVTKQNNIHTYDIYRFQGNLLNNNQL